MDYTKAEFWLSLAAVILSVISIFCSGILNKKINNINLQADIIIDVVKSFIKDKLPQAREKVRFNRGKLLGVEYLQNVLNDFRKDIIFIRYVDSRFFNKVKKYSQDLEDYVVENEGKKFESFEQENVQKNITRKMVKIMKLINKKYIG